MRLPRRHRFDPAVAVGALIGLALSYFLLSDRNLLLAAIAFDAGLVLSLIGVRLVFGRDRDDAVTLADEVQHPGAQIVSLPARDNLQHGGVTRPNCGDMRNAA